MIAHDHLSYTTMFKDVKNEFMENGYGAAMKVLAQNLEKNIMISVAPISALYNRAGMHHDAVRMLEIGYERHDPDMPYVFVSIELSNLKSDPRFVELARKMNLPL